MVDPPQKGQIQGTQGEEKCPILVFFLQTLLILVTTMHCKLHYELKNAWNVVKNFMSNLNPFNFH